MDDYGACNTLSATCGVMVMMQILYPVFEINGEEYVADASAVLTMNPPQYNAYRLSDKKHIYIRCDSTSGRKIMYPHDFHEWMYGKRKENQAQILGMNGEIVSSAVNFTHDSTVQVDPVTHEKPKSTQEQVEELQERVKVLEAIIEGMTTKE